MSPPEHDHVGVGGGLGPERVAQRLDRRDHRALDLLDGGDVHDRREGIVRRLRPVDVVVRMDRRLAAAAGAGQLVGPTGDDLVGVHVGLRARPGLEDDQRELAVEPAVDDLLGGSLDRVGLVGGKLAELEVRPGRAQLEDPQGPDDRPAPGEPADPDPEVFDRPLGLRAPVVLGRDADLAECVLLDPEACGRGGGWVAGSGRRHAAECSVGRQRPTLESSVRSSRRGGFGGRGAVTPAAVLPSQRGHAGTEQAGHDTHAERDMKGGDER